MNSSQDISITVCDEELCAPFNEHEIELTVEVEARAVNDYVGAFGFYQDFTTYEDVKVGTAWEINGVQYTKGELVTKMGSAKYMLLEQKVIDAIDDNVWNDPDESDYAGDYD